MRTIVVGGGIAGLVTAERLAAAGDTVTILEKYDYFGGRVLTAKSGVEIGAGRIHDAHVRVAALVERFGLHIRHHSPRSDWMPLATHKHTKNTFADVWGAHVDIFRRLPRHILATHTVRELAGLVLGRERTEHLLEQFPYRDETEHLRADIALNIYREAGNVWTPGGFYSVAEGLSAIVRGLVVGLTAAGVTLRSSMEVTDVTRTQRGRYAVFVKSRERPFVADRVVLALHATALKHLPVMRPFWPLRYLEMTRLIRIYAQYPVSPSAPAWFADLSRIITDSPLRYIIPIDASKGIIMVSYTNARDTEAWWGLKGQALTAAIQRELRRLFQDRTIPEPTWLRTYEWHEGCTSWMPGMYDPAAASIAALQPFPDRMPGLYMCGESFSVTKQAWIEGALEHAEELWNRHLRPDAATKP